MKLCRAAIEHQQHRTVVTLHCAGVEVWGRFDDQAGAERFAESAQRWHDETCKPEEPLH